MILGWQERTSFLVSSLNWPLKVQKQSSCSVLICISQNVRKPARRINFHSAMVSCTIFRLSARPFQSPNDFWKASIAQNKSASTSWLQNRNIGKQGVVSSLWAIQLLRSADFVPSGSGDGMREADFQCLTEYWRLRFSYQGCQGKYHDHWWISFGSHWSWRQVCWRLS